MKKLTIFLIPILVSFTGCKEQEPIARTLIDWFTPYYEYHNGKIKSVKEENFWAVEKDGQIEKGNILTDKERQDSILWTSDFEAFYDEEGIVTRVNNLNDEGGIAGFWVATIEDGKIIRADRNEKDTARYYTLISYDELGYYKESKRYNAMNDTLLNTYLFKTDEKGRIIEQVNQNHLGEILSKYSCDYNEEGLIAEYNYFTKEDSLTYHRGFTYNDKGFILTDDIYDGEMNLTDSYKLEYTEYNDNGSWLTVIYYRNDKPTIITERTYTYY